MIRNYHNHKSQTTPWHCKEEPLNHHETPGRQIKQSIQLSLPKADIKTMTQMKKKTVRIQSNSVTLKGEVIYMYLKLININLILLKLLTPPPDI